MKNLILILIATITESVSSFLFGYSLYKILFSDDDNFLMFVISIILFFCGFIISRKAK